MVVKIFLNFFKLFSDFTPKSQISQLQISQLLKLADNKQTEMTRRYRYARWRLSTWAAAVGIPTRANEWTLAQSTDHRGNLSTIIATNNDARAWEREHVVSAVYKLVFQRISAAAWLDRMKNE